MSRVVPLLLACVSVPAIAQGGSSPSQPPAIASSAQGDVAITIYSQMALVEDKRTITLPAGVSRQEFPDVSAAIRPETVTLGGAGIDIVEQNFDYDLLTPDSLMRKAQGQTVTLLRTNTATGAETKDSAKVLAVNGGVVLETGGHVEVLRDDGLPVRVLFDRIPPSLRARPTLSVTLNADKAGAQALTLNYLTTGLGWQADYVGMFDEARSQMNLQGWITLTNSTGTPFPDAKLTLAAGDLMALQQSRRGQGNAGISRPNGDSGSDENRLGDLYLYPLEARTTVATNQKKQVSFLDVAGVAARRSYRYECNWRCEREEPESATSILRFATGAKGGLGSALPAGTVRVYMRDAEGKTRFVGESLIGHTAAGSDVDLPTALAFDVKVRPIQESRDRITDAEWTDSHRYRVVKDGAVSTVTVQNQQTYWRTKMRYIVTNARSQPVEVEVRQNGMQAWFYGTRITEESIVGRQDGSDLRIWTVPVPAKGQTELTVTYLSSF